MEREFHRVGATTWKALFMAAIPLTSLGGGITNRATSDDFRRWTEWHGRRQSLKYYIIIGIKGSLSLSLSEVNITK